MTKEKQNEVYRTSLMLPKLLWIDAKMTAIRQGLKFQELVAIALREYLAKHGGAR